MTKHVLPGFGSDENRIDFEEGLRGGVYNLVIPFTGFSRKGRRPGPDPGAEKHPFRTEIS
jgi:hypothetical protein